jgi:hypothetical protein
MRKVWIEAALNGVWSRALPDHIHLSVEGNGRLATMLVGMVR